MQQINVLYFEFYFAVTLPGNYFKIKETHAVTWYNRLPWLW